MDSQHAEPGEIAYAVLYTSNDYSELGGDAQRGYFYTYTFLYDNNNNLIDEGYYEVNWGGHERHAPEITQDADEVIEDAQEKTDSISQQ